MIKAVLLVDLMNSLNILAGAMFFFAKLDKGKSEYALNYTAAFQRINTITEIAQVVISLKIHTPILEKNQYQR